MARYEDFSVTKLRVDQVMLGAGNVVAQTSSRTLTAEDNGKTFILSDSAPGVITLPAVTNTGFSIKVICGIAMSSVGQVTSAEGTNMEGALMVASTVVNVDGASTLSFVQSAENIGDWVTVFSDGTQWLVDGRALSTGGLLPS